MEQEQTKKAATSDTYSYKGWLVSDKFVKRALAVYGYSMVVGLVLSIPFFILGMLVLLTASITQNSGVTSY